MNTIIEIEMSKGLTWPQIQFVNPSFIVSSVTTDEYTVSITYSCLTKSYIKFLYLNKTSDETTVDASGNIIRDQCITIKNFWVNDILVPLDFLNEKSNYYPLYHKDFIKYCKDNQLTIDPGPLHTNNFWHAGTWELAMSENFWDWYAEWVDSRAPLLASNDLIGYKKDDVWVELSKLKKILNNV